LDVLNNPRDLIELIWSEARQHSLQYVKGVKGNEGARLFVQGCQNVLRVISIPSEIDKRNRR